LAAGVVAGRLTRGVVAVHQDDDDNSAPGYSSAGTAQTGYIAGAYGTTEGYGGTGGYAQGAGSVGYDTPGGYSTGAGYETTGYASGGAAAGGIEP
jgi:hypothetical protein